MKKKNPQDKRISIQEFIRFIKRLPEDEPQTRPGIWYWTQKEYWLGWLGDYHTARAYSRQTGIKRDSCFVYNHIVCPDMLMYLIKAIPLSSKIIDLTQHAYENMETLTEKAGAIRKVVPWSMIYESFMETT